MAWVLALRAELQIPPTLAGIVEESFANEAAGAGASIRRRTTNPVPLDEAALRGIFLRRARRNG